MGLKRLAKNLLQSANIEVGLTKPYPEKVAGMPHCRSFPLATYAPWLADEKFQILFERIRQNTLVDEYRCWELYTLARQMAKLPAGDVLEVGVWRGGTGCLIAKVMQDSNQSRTIYLADTFEGVVKASEEDTGYRGGEHSDTSKDVVLGLAKDLALTNIQVLQGIFPEDTAHEIESAQFVLCHIDVDVYQSALDVFQWVWPRLHSGGFVVFDDYGFYGCEGVTKLVNEIALRPDLLFVHNLNGHALLVKR